MGDWYRSVMMCKPKEQERTGAEKGVGTVLIGNHALAPFKKRMFFVEGEYFF